MVNTLLILGTHHIELEQFCRGDYSYILDNSYNSLNEARSVKCPQLGKQEKTRVYLMIEKPDLDQLDHLVEEGIYLNRREAIRDALRHNLRRKGIEPFATKGASLEAKDTDQ